MRRMLNLVVELAARVVGAIRYVAFRAARARALRKAKREDPNIYPMF